MKFKKIIYTLMYDEFGNKDYEGFILPFVFLSPAIGLLALLFILSIVG